MAVIVYLTASNVGQLRYKGKVIALFTCILVRNKNLAITNRSRVSCAHNTSRAFMGLNITP